MVLLAQEAPRAAEAWSELHFCPWLALQKGVFHLAAVSVIALLI